jgi:hypothetical protein
VPHLGRDLDDFASFVAHGPLSGSERAEAIARVHALRARLAPAG